MGRPRKQDGVKGSTVSMYVAKPDDTDSRTVALDALADEATHFYFRGRVYEVRLDYKPVEGGE